MTRADDPAFSGTDYEHELPIGVTPGLTKRELFAALAMNAYIIADGYNSTYRGAETDSPEEIADMAVDYADALIEQLNRRLGR